MFRVLWPQTKFGAGPRVVYENSPFHDRYELAMKKTGMVDNPMRRLRHFGIQQAVRATANVPGDACEMGSLAGLSAWLAADAFRQMQAKLTFHLIDSFEGLSEYTDKDRNESGAMPNISPQHFKQPEEAIRRNLAEFDFIEIHKGWIPEPFAALADSRFRYAHIDVDLYEPTRDSIRFVWDRLSSKGVVLFDDYGSHLFPGARAAVDEFFGGRDDYFLYEQPGGQAVAVKF